MYVSKIFLQAENKPMKINEAVSARIKAILKEKNMSQYRLERETGLYHSTLVNIMRHKTSSCNVTTIALIAQAVGMSLAEFFDDPVFEIYDLDID